jgi:AraC-like DNA-binding protein
MPASYRPSTFSGTVAESNAERVARLGRPRGHARGRSASGGRIAAARMFELWAELVHELDAPELPIRAAEHFRLEDLGLLGLVVSSAPTVAAGLESFARFGALLNDGRTFDLSGDARTVTLTLRDGSPLVLGVRLSHEATFAQVDRGMKELVGASVRPLQVSFRHERSSAARALRAYFSCPVELGADHDCMVFSREDLERVRTAGNAPVWRYLCERAEEGVATLAPRPLLERVRSLVALSVQAGEVPGLERAAMDLGMSSRTLRRALASERTSFRELLDGSRRSRAEELLRSSRHPLTRIALDLGFSDSSAFAHACRRWFGASPGAVAVRARRSRG